MPKRTYPNAHIPFGGTTQPKPRGIHARRLQERQSVPPKVMLEGNDVPTRTEADAAYWRAFVPPPAPLPVHLSTVADTLPAPVLPGTTPRPGALPVHLLRDAPVLDTARVLEQRRARPKPAPVVTPRATVVPGVSLPDAHGPLSVACPVCMAEAGARCVRTAGKRKARVVPTHIHPQRRMAALPEHAGWSLADLTAAWETRRHTLPR